MEQARSHGVAIATLVMLGIMIATVVGWWVLLPEIAPKRITIAVLPFEQSQGSPQESPYLGEGIAADIAIALAEVPDFIVLDRAASFSYRSRGGVSQLLAGELGATHAVEGRVRRAGGAITVSARLTDLSEFLVLWEEDLSGADAELFAIRDAIAVGIAKKLLLLGDVAVSAGPPVDLHAYETFLEARAVADAGNTVTARRPSPNGPSRWTPTTPMRTTCSRICTTGRAGPRLQRTLRRRSPSIPIPHRPRRSRHTCASSRTASWLPITGR